MRMRTWETAMFEYTKVLTSFSVGDVPKAKKFYSETLGLKVSEESGALLLHLSGGNDTLIYPKPDHIPASYTFSTSWLQRSTGQ